MHTLYVCTLCVMVYVVFVPWLCVEVRCCCAYYVAVARRCVCWCGVSVPSVYVYVTTVLDDVGGVVFHY